MQRHREADAKAVEEAWKKTKEANKGKPRSKEAEYLRKKAKETFAEIDKSDGKKFGLDDPLIKLFREAGKIIICYFHCYDTNCNFR